MKKKLLKIFLILLGIGVLSGIGVYIYVFHKPHRNLANEDAQFVVTAPQLLSEFSTSEDSTYKKYGDKALQVKGKIVDITAQGKDLTIILEDKSTGVSCSFETEYLAKNKEALNKLKIGDEVTIKGKCDGYDAIMGVVLTRCVLPE
jgi:hypothetical protein